MLRRVWLAGAIAGICLAGFGAQAAEVPLAFKVKNGRLAAGPKVVKVKRGDRIVLVVQSDKADELHVHGYDLHRKVAANRPARLQFTAGRTGRFGAELHKSGIQLVVLEIYPK